MLQGFVCPDNTRIDKKDCLKQCRMQEECLPMPALLAVAEEREWTGTPSTTQLLSGPMLNVLKLNKPYYVRPTDRLYAIMGTRMHSRLDRFAKVAGLVSEYKIDGEITGICDLLEPDRHNGGYIISDYKLWGSYQVMRAIKHKDVTNERLQVNHYRVKIEQCEPLAELVGQKIEITQMRLWVVVRDGNTKTAKENMVRLPCYMIPIEPIDDIKLLDWFNGRRDELLSAMDNFTQKETLPRICNDRENWKGRRCKGFCDVSEFCPKGQRGSSKWARSN